MVDEKFISDMKDGAILINTARGALLDEEAVAAALKNGKIAGAALDVLAQEPPQENHPLIGLDNCWITPHIAFTPVETRKVVVDTCGANLKSFIEGGNLNRLV
jgi:glycerate dehydrogenase